MTGTARPARRNAASFPGMGKEYLELLKGALTRTLFMDPESPHYRTRYDGLDWPGDGDADTMIGVARLNEIEMLLARAVSDGVPGDAMECGIWRGGAVAYMRGVLNALGEAERKVYGCDSFRGCPLPDPAVPQDAGDVHHTLRFLRVGREAVEAMLRRYRLREGVELVEGFFSESLPRLLEERPELRLCLLRIDADMYSSTTAVLEAMYGRLEPGGFVIVDDYWNIASCRQAVGDFRARAGISAPLQSGNWCSVWWRKER